MTNTKVCTKCKVEKDFEEFHKSSVHKYGYAPRCKVCRSQYYENNKEARKNYQLDYYKKNRGKARQYYERNKERKAAYYIDNREARREYDRQYRKNNPDKRRALHHKRRARKKNVGGVFTATEFQQLCEDYGNMCLCCGRDDVKLTADHVIPISKGGSNDIDNIQPLCKSCNCSKGTKIIDYREKADDS